MCGIAGLVFTDGSQPSVNQVDRLAAALKHRGPDGEGRLNVGAINLVHRRLAIIDLKTGDQPFEDGDGISLIANGEIYNYKQRLYRQRQRTRQGHRHAAMRTFATRGDSARLPRHAIQPGRLNQRRCDPPVAEAGFCHCRDPARSV